MKVLIVSDTHGKEGNLKEAILHGSSPSTC